MKGTDQDQMEIAPARLGALHLRPEEQDEAHQPPKRNLGQR
jgi:hypothetical protein